MIVPDIDEEEGPFKLPDRNAVGAAVFSLILNELIKEVDESVELVKYKDDDVIDLVISVVAILWEFWLATITV